MAWLRQTIGPGSNLQGLKAHLERDFEGLEGIIARYETAFQVLFDIVELNGLVLLYQWEDTIDTTTAPPTGYLKGNSAQLQSITELAISYTDGYGRDVRIPNANLLNIGDLITLAASDLGGAYVYAVTADPIEESTFFRLPVAAVDGNRTNNTQDEFMRVSWRPSNIQGELLRV